MQRSLFNNLKKYVLSSNSNHLLSQSKKYFSQDLTLDQNMQKLMNTESEQDIFIQRANQLLDQGEIKLKAYDSNEMVVKSETIGIPFILHGVQVKPENRTGWNISSF